MSTSRATREVAVNLAEASCPGTKGGHHDPTHHGHRSLGRSVPGGRRSRIGPRRIRRRRLDDECLRHIGGLRRDLRRRRRRIRHDRIRRHDAHRARRRSGRRMVRRDRAVGRTRGRSGLPGRHRPDAVRRPVRGRRGPDPYRTGRRLISLPSLPQRPGASPGRHRVRGRMYPLTRAGAIMGVSADSARNDAGRQEVDRCDD